MTLHVTRMKLLHFRLEKQCGGDSTKQTQLPMWSEYFGDCSPGELPRLSEMKSMNVMNIFHNSESVCAPAYCPTTEKTEF